MGKPKRNKEFKFRVTEEEANKVYQAAAKAGYENNVSAFFRENLFGQTSLDEKTKKFKTCQNERKEERLSLRVSLKEKKYINEQITASGLSSSEYLRRAALNQKIHVMNQQTLKKLVHELVKMGANLNQLLILCHMGKVTYPNINEVIALFHTLLKEVNKLMQEVN